jgi:hypothetical protein
VFWIEARFTFLCVIIFIIRLAFFYQGVIHSFIVQSLLSCHYYPLGHHYTECSASDSQVPPAVSILIEFSVASFLLGLSWQASDANVHGTMHADHPVALMGA